MKDLNGYTNFYNKVSSDNTEKFYNIYIGVIN